MDTISWRLLCKRERKPPSWRSERVSAYPAEIRGRLIAVSDTLAALQELAQAVRRAWGRRIAAVTGSVGKTTTKEILAALLGAKFRVLKSEGNLNNEYGLPLTLLRLEPEDKAAVVELGMSHRGELRRLAEIAEPEVGVVTRVAPVHLEFFASVDEIALAKRELIEGLAGPEPVAVLNADDPRVARFSEVARGRVLTFGCGAQADFRAEKIQDRGAAGSEFDLIAHGERTRLRLALPGRHSIENALAALAAASVWEIGAERGRGCFPPYQSRRRCAAGCCEFAAGFAVINDSYNSNPVALAAMIDLLSHTGAQSGGRAASIAGTFWRPAKCWSWGRSPRICIARRAAQPPRRKLDWIVGVQGQAAEIVNGAIERGHARVAGALLRRLFRRRGISCRSCEAGRSAAGERIARSEDGAHRRSAAGEISRWRKKRHRCRRRSTQLKCSTTSSTTSRRAMAHLLNVFRYITVRTALASLSALFLGLILGPWMIRRLRATANRPVHSRRRAQQPPVESRHADHGRRSDRDGHARAHAALGRPRQCLCAARDLHDAGFRRHRLCRRLQQSCAPPQSRPHRPVENPLADPGELRGGAGAAFDDRQPAAIRRS